MKFFTSLTCLLGVISAINVNEVHEQPSTNIFNLLTTKRMSKEERRAKKLHDKGSDIDKFVTLSGALISKGSEN